MTFKEKYNIDGICYYLEKYHNIYDRKKQMKVVHPLYKYFNLNNERDSHTDIIINKDSEEVEKLISIFILQNS